MTGHPRDSSIQTVPIMENQMEKKMENDMKTGDIYIYTHIQGSKPTNNTNIGF